MDIWTSSRLRLTCHLAGLRLCQYPAWHGPLELHPSLAYKHFHFRMCATALTGFCWKYKVLRPSTCSITWHVRHNWNYGAKTLSCTDPSKQTRLLGWQNGVGWVVTFKIYIWSLSKTGQGTSTYTWCRFTWPDPHNQHLMHVNLFNLTQPVESWPKPNPCQIIGLFQILKLYLSETAGQKYSYTNSTSSK